MVGEAGEVLEFYSYLPDEPCLSFKGQKTRRNSHCHVVVPINFDKKSENVQDSPISPWQGNLTFKMIIKHYK